MEKVRFVSAFGPRRLPYLFSWCYPYPTTHQRLPSVIRCRHNHSTQEQDVQYFAPHSSRTPPRSSLSTHNVLITQTTYLLVPSRLPVLRLVFASAIPRHPAFGASALSQLSAHAAKPHPPSPGVRARLLLRQDRCLSLKRTSKTARSTRESSGEEGLPVVLTRIIH